MITPATLTWHLGTAPIFASEHIWRVPRRNWRFARCFQRSPPPTRRDVDVRTPTEVTLKSSAVCMEGRLLEPQKPAALRNVYAELAGLTAETFLPSIEIEIASPSVVHQIQELPPNSKGKVDRGSLRILGGESQT
jgi:hypothetical protein